MRMCRCFYGFLAYVLALPIAVQAHMFVPHREDSEFSLWTVDPVALALLLLTAFFYWRGHRRLPARQGRTYAIWRKRQLYFWCGWASLFVVLATPLDPLGEVLFSVHMVQHEVMMLLAAPLLVLSRPTSALLRGAPGFIAQAFAWVTRRRRVMGLWDTMVSPAGAWTIHAVGLWAWHLPSLFNAGLESTPVHALQHMSFLWISLVFWYSLVKPQQINTSVGIIYLFTTAIHASLLGALLTFSPEVWYEPYIATAPQWGLTALEDQQLGGLIMWMPAGVAFVAAGLWSLARLMRMSDRGSTQAQRERESTL